MTQAPQPDQAILFAQVACTAEPEFLRTKNFWGLGCSVIGLFMCVYWRFSITHIQNEQKI